MIHVARDHFPTPEDIQSDLDRILGQTRRAVLMYGLCARIEERRDEHWAEVVADWFATSPSVDRFEVVTEVYSRLWNACADRGSDRDEGLDPRKQNVAQR